MIRKFQDKKEISDSLDQFSKVSTSVFRCENYKFFYTVVKKKRIKVGKF